MKNDNVEILARLRGVSAQSGTPETDADPRNPNVRIPAVSDPWKHGAEAMRHAILQQLPGGQTCDPQQIADMIRAIALPDAAKRTPAGAREDLAWAICPSIREYSCGENADPACHRCPETVDTPYGAGQQACRRAANNAADAVFALLPAADDRVRAALREELEACARMVTDHLGASRGELAAAIRARQGSAG